MKWVKVLLAAMAALAVSVSATVGGAVPANASASASGKTTVASQLAGSKAKSVTNCGEHTCTAYHNRKATRVWAQEMPSLMLKMNVVSAATCAASTHLIVKELGKKLKRAKDMDLPISVASSIGDTLLDVCKTEEHKYMEDLAAQSVNAKDVNGCVEVESNKKGKIIRVGYTTHPDWCGGN
jgi:hypothetical protein